MTHVRCRGRNNIAPLLGRGEVQRNERETTREYLHAPCMLAFSPIILQRSDEDNAPAVQHERPLLETISFKSSTSNDSYQDLLKVVNEKVQYLCITSKSNGGAVPRLPYRTRRRWVWCCFCDIAKVLKSTGNFVDDICNMSFKWRSGRRVEVYSLRNSFSKKAAHSNMCFQTYALYVLHCHTDENTGISGYILYKSWQLEMNHIWRSTYWMIEVQLLPLASDVAQYWHPLKTEWQIIRICHFDFSNRKIAIQIQF